MKRTSDYRTMLCGLIAGGLWILQMPAAIGQALAPLPTLTPTETPTSTPTAMPTGRAPVLAPPSATPPSTLSGNNAPAPIVRLTSSFSVRTTETFKSVLPRYGPAYLSSDGSTVAFIVEQEADEGYGNVLYVAKLDYQGRGVGIRRGSAVAVTDKGWVIGDPSLSGDGSRMAVALSDGGEDTVRLFRISSAGQRELIWQAPPQQESDAYYSINGVGLSEDGTRLVYSSVSRMEGEAWDSLTEKVTLVTFGREAVVEDIFSREISDDDDILRVVGVSVDGKTVICTRSSGSKDLEGIGQLLRLDPQSKQMTSIISDAAGLSSVSMNATGTIVAYASASPTLVPRDTNRSMDVFQTLLVEPRQTIRVSQTRGANGQGNFSSGQPRISSTGRYVVFMSKADNLGRSDLNFSSDVFVYDTQTDTLKAPLNIVNNSDVKHPSVSDVKKGRNVVAFWSDASNLVPEDTNGLPDLFLAIF